ncbi:hypothetical protein OG729_22965 [Streptomyces sp. NBC_00210]|uniref:hypothetical protein n=1 Tax=Streptomyces sp. NBC_00210 TaxID=2903636 RepID=UPI0032494D20
MALVFIHGIGNRDPGEFDGVTKLRDGLFKKHLLPAIYRDPDAVSIFSPHWGVHGGKLRWNHASLPYSTREPLSAGDDDLWGIAAAAAPLDVQPQAVLVAIARSSVRNAIDLLFTCADLRDREPDEISELVDVAIQLDAYCRNQETDRPSGPEKVRHPWLVDCDDDEDFVDLLLREAVPVGEPGADEAMGGKGVGGLAGKILRGTPERVQTALAATAARGVRRLFSERVSLLLGDVFAYLKEPDQIRGVVVAGIRDAIDDTPPGDQLVVVSHSMGGNIVYDILSNSPELHVDVLITVGSQVGLFAELGMFSSIGSASTESAKVPRLTNVDRWINVMDDNDILGYHAVPIFDGVQDYYYPTREVWAHSAYFRQPNFHARLAERISECSS